MSAILGIFFHALGGFAAGSFYIPMKLLKKWSWESGWLILGLAAWVIAPWVAGWLTVPDLWSTFTGSPGNSLFWSYFFGVLWGIGGLTFGLTMRYLGLSLGMALALGLTAAFGTLIPPIYEGTFAQLLQTRAGLITFAGVIICLAGIAICGWAGARKEKEVDEVQKKNTGNPNFWFIHYTSFDDPHRHGKSILISQTASVSKSYIFENINSNEKTLHHYCNTRHPVISTEH